MRTPFNLTEWLKDKSRKVVNKDGQAVTIMPEPIFLDEHGIPCVTYRVATPGHTFSVMTQSYMDSLSFSDENEEEAKWRKENAADEQLAAVNSWADYEDYDIVYRCKTMEVLIELYRFILFDVGVEFVQSVQELIEEEIEDGETTTLDKALAWDKAHGTDFFYDPREDNKELAEECKRESLRHRISAILMDTAEDNPFVFIFPVPIGEHKLVGMSTLELPCVVTAFQDSEARIWFNIHGYDEPMNFDDMDTEDLQRICDDLHTL